MTGFLALVLCGSFVLALPGAAVGDRLELVDALFQATSAVCVTGLVTIDVGSQLTPAGQAAVLALIQLGAFGIGVVSIALLIAAGRATLHTHAAAGAQLAAVRVRPLRLLLWVVALTLACELVGAVALRLALGEQGSWWSALFHSVSAFCNAGFSLQSDSLTGFRAAPAVLWTVAALIALGGLGFLVLRELLLCGLALLRRTRCRVFLHTRVVLWSSLVLWLLGALWFLALERHGAMAGMSFGEQLDAAVLQSVTTRTAGFSSVDFGALRPITLFGTMVLMFVGGAPGGVAGGVKVTTVVVTLAALRAWLRGSESVWLFGRTVPPHLVRRAYQLVLWSLLFVSVAIAVLLASQEHLRSGSEGQLPGADYAMGIAFETVSAFGTVGLSTGITAALTPFGKVVLVVTMLVGRIGPLVFAVALLRPGPAPSFEYPEEELATG